MAEKLTSGKPHKHHGLNTRLSPVVMKTMSNRLPMAQRIHRLRPQFKNAIAGFLCYTGTVAEFPSCAPSEMSQERLPLPVVLTLSSVFAAGLSTIEPHTWFRGAKLTHTVKPRSKSIHTLHVACQLLAPASGSAAEKGTVGRVVYRVFRPLFPSHVLIPRLPVG